MLPGLVFSPTENVLLSVIARTLYIPLNPRLSKPLLLFSDFNLVTSTILPTFSLCEFCAVTIATLPAHVASTILVLVLKLLTLVSVSLTEPYMSSSITADDSSIENPLLGAAASVADSGITYLTL